MAISVSGISGMSMNPIAGVRTVGSRPMNYAVENESEISDAFSESMAVANAGSVTGATPVQYANAQREERTPGVPSMDAARANRFYNNIASAYQGMSTSYDASGAAGQYAMIGSNIDLTA